MKILVTGGTGFVGRAVVAALAEAGHVSRVLVRQPAAPRARELAGRFPVELVVGDVLKPDTLRAALWGCEAVIHLVGIISEVGQNTFENAHTQATRHLVGAAQVGGVQRFLHMSALGTRPNAASRYHQTKWAAEEAVRASGLDWTIFRPSLIYGPEDHFTRMMANLSRWSPVLPVMGTGKGRLQPIAVEVVALAFARALTQPATSGRTLDLCGPERLTFNEVLDAILAAVGRRRVKCHLPLPVARGLAGLLEVVFPQLLGLAAPLNRDQLLMLQEDNVGDPAPAQTLLNLPVESFREGLARYLKPAARGV